MDGWWLSSYYFNEMTFYDEYNCIALGEGRKFYKYCITYRGWWKSLERRLFTS
jgi:hypothetical protein